MTIADQASNRFYALVRDFALTTPEWAPAVRYFTQPDERLDLTLVSARVYGTRDEFLTIQAAAGLDSPESELVEQLLVLPGMDQLRAMRREAGYDGYEVF
jgi:hypothetical protein